MITSEHLHREIILLNEAQRELVAQFIAFLKFQAHNFQPIITPPSYDEAELAQRYAEFAQEDHELAESGLADYVLLLQLEDNA
jgi:hypothetical protein